MKKKMRFVWIDDSPQRKTSAENFEKAKNISIEFKEVRNNSLEDSLNISEPDLIIMDHNLENMASRIFQTGSTAASFIREKWPECPVVCVTGVSKNDVDDQKRKYYEDLFEINKISKYYDSIISIAEGFRKLKAKRPKNSSELLKLMNAPKTDLERLSSVLPHQLKIDLVPKNKSQIFNISQWTRKTLLERPGFLYDKLWVATLLGLKEEGFDKVEKMFESAIYSGIFAEPSQKRWWKSKVLAILSEHVEGVGLPWVKGRKLPKITKKDYSKCYQSNSDFPETVAYVDDTIGSSRAAMRLQNTIPHPVYEDLVFFEEIRMMKA